MSAEACNNDLNDLPVAARVAWTTEPEVHETRIIPASVEAVVDGSSEVLFLGELGVFSVASVQEHGRRDGHVVTGTVETPEDGSRAARAHFYRRSLVRKLLGRPVRAYVWLGMPQDNYPTGAEQ
ncbi:MAG TPA: hypothetical protein VHD60_00440 [Candidatus Saccharimonadales bacterium]|nr:hypothetical protein [Candidatus Saccharimonadales bacterium]